jgi:hypothetical protein
MAEHAASASAPPGEPQPQAHEAPQEAPQEQRPGFRGRCLYKTGKCTNERALKTSGAAHNLCEDHRNRQNQHQRKLDAKNRVARKDKRGSRSPGDAAPRTPAARFSPYPAVAVAAAKKHSASLDAAEMAALAPASPSSATAAAAASAPASAQSPPTTGMHGLALQHVPMPGDAAATTAAAGAAAAVAAAANSGGMVYLPNGPQPPQLAYPFVMQDFDGIVVPLPSYLEGQDRIEFRARIYQKVLDFISEECILRFSGAGARGLPDSKTPAAGRPNDSAVAPAPAPTRSVSSSSSTSTEAGAASPSPVAAAQPAAEEPAGVDVGAGSETPSNGAPKRLKRAARS